MRCDACKIRDATVHLTEIINNKVTKLHLCEQCAREKSQEMEEHFGLADLLSGLADLLLHILSEQARNQKLQSGYSEFDRHRHN